jgi:hypothetical protein
MFGLASPDCCPWQSLTVPVETGVHATRGVSVRADLWLREFSKFRDVVCVASMVS